MGVLRVFAFEYGVGTSPYAGDLQCAHGSAFACVPWYGLHSDTRHMGCAATQHRYRLIVGARTARSGLPVSLRYQVFTLQIVLIVRCCVTYCACRGFVKT